MMNGLVAKRYARALFEVAQENHLLDQVAADLETMIDIIQNTEGFTTFLYHPSIEKEAKKDLMEKAFGESISWVSKNFMLLLIDSGREDVLEEIYAEYSKLSNEAKGVSLVTAVTAVPLGEEEKQELVQIYGQKLKKAIQLNNVVDPTIIGGMVVKIGDRIYDGSLKRKLQLVNKSLMASRV